MVYTDITNLFHITTKSLQMKGIFPATPVLASDDCPNVSHHVVAVSDNFLVFFCTRCLVGNPSGRSFGDVAFLEHSNLLQNIESEMQLFSFPLRMFISVSCFPHSDYHS